LLERQRSASEERVERFAGNELEDEEALAAVLFDPVDRGDVRMIQRRQESRLALESRQRIRILRQRRRQRLDRDLPPQAWVGRAIDIAHPSRSQRIHDLVGADASAGCDLQPLNYTTAAVR